jgi:hypothetical protein
MSKQYMAINPHDEDDLLIGEYNKKKRFFEKVNFTKVYAVWILTSVTMGISMYLDYKCSGYVLIQPNYYYSLQYEPLELNSDTSLNGSNLMSSNYLCRVDRDCGEHGLCKLDRDVFGNITGSVCMCQDAYVTVDYNMCSYHQLSGWLVLVISIFFGKCGIDRCLLSRGNLCGICAGILKALTLGGCGIWWIIDIILFLCGDLYDGNGQKLNYKI